MNCDNGCENIYPIVICYDCKKNICYSCVAHVAGHHFILRNYCVDCHSKIETKEITINSNI